MGESQALERLRFFAGQLLTAEDFALEQQYVREKLKRHNRSLHGFGIVSGLKVSVKSGQVIVDAGLALDCEGNELVIGTAQSLAPPPGAAWHTAYVSVRFAEACAEQISTAGCEEVSRIVETFEISFAPENSNRGHRHLRARWLACGKPHALTIAKLKQGAHGWRVERGYRAPSIK